MAIGAITMILANVGLQIYNNWCGSRQNAALQQKREEFERAAKERNTEHMWRLMREGQELTMQLEMEKHADRLNELKDEVDHLLEKLTYETTISNWPLKVLPIVMKNQAFGNLLANQEENIAMHVIFTRSNYDKFNKLVFPIVEKQLEQYCDKYWSTMTNHPILFYSGAWKPAVNPTDVQVMAMREELKNLPTLLITPFFRPNDGKLVFQLHMWGVGANSTDKFDVPEIEPTDFQRPFNNQDDYDNEDGLLEEIVEDLVPYLECMIGYMADTYFWSSAGLAPHLPLLLTSGAINTDGMKYLLEETKNYYLTLLDKGVEQIPVFNDACLLEFNIGLEPFCNLDNKRNILRQIFLEHFKKLSSKSYAEIVDVIKDAPWFLADVSFITKLLEVAKTLDDEIAYSRLWPVKRELDSINYNYDILRIKDYSVVSQEVDKGNVVAMFRLGELYEYSMGIEENIDLANFYYKKSAEHGFILAKIKIGTEGYEVLSKRAIDILHALSVVQVDLLYIEELLKKNPLGKDSCKALYKSITRPLILSGRLYSHVGLITSLALLMIKSGLDSNVPRSMLEMASKIG